MLAKVPSESVFFVCHYVYNVTPFGTHLYKGAHFSVQNLPDKKWPKISPPALGALAAACAVIVEPRLDRAVT